MDAFLLSHTYEPVDVADQEAVDQFLPPYSPRFQLDPKDPYALSQFMMPAVYMELRHSIHKTMEKVPLFYAAIEDAFNDIFGREYGVMEAVQCEDADIVFVVSGVVTSNCRLAISELRSKGEKVGFLKIKMFRPFPADLVRQHLVNARKAAVIDRNFSMGASGIFAQETRAALCNLDKRPKVFGYVAGLGGRDITTDTINEIYWMTKNDTAPEADSVWIGLNE
jgi:pyruvate/2-oxoacid:ferredoxin oxidoreductase alpha subunit